MTDRADAMRVAALCAKPGRAGPRLLSARRQRGVSLIEALVALAVMALGMLAIAGIQATMRLNADVARQRTEANRIAQSEMEAMRAFVQMNSEVGKLAWDDIVADGPNNVAVEAANTTFALRREVVTVDDPAHKLLRVTVDWNDRSGQAQSVVLNSVIAGIEPKLGGMLSVAPAATAVDRPRGRHPTIPSPAKDLGNGSSGFVPATGATVAWVFDNTTGVITSVCTVLSGTTNLSLTTNDLSSCSDTHAQLLAGVVRFQLGDGAAALKAADAENPPGPALNLNVLLGLVSTGHSASPVCFDDSPTTAATASSTVSVAYFCIVFPNAANTWSGVSVLSPQAFSDNGASWTVTSGGSHIVCRYTTAASDTTGNFDHPHAYVDVKGNLVNQNFMVILASKACPTDVAPNPAAGDLINSNTLQHQP